jgi:hypothetical protein
LVIILTLLSATSLPAQQRDVRFESQDTTRRDIRSPWRPLRVAKWSTLLASTGAAAYGFNQNRVADREYEELEEICFGNPALCEKATGTDRYVDAAMEARYQEIVDRDDRARLALLAGQLGLIASLAMFIFDLPDKSTPEDIPYDPKPLRFELGRNGLAELQFHTRLLRF